MNARVVFFLLLLLMATVTTALAPVGADAQGYSYGQDPHSKTQREGSGQPSRNPEHGVIDWLTSPVAGLMQLLYLLLSLFMGLMGILLDLAGKFLDVVLSVKNYAGVPLIIDGWKFIRDLTNFVFIFVLLAIAFSTIAGLESLQARQTLPKLLIAALLVNFSLGIGGAINGVATCVMNTAISSLPRPPRAGNPSRADFFQGGPATPAGQNKSNRICGGGDNLGSTLVQGVANSASVGTYFAFGPSKLAGLVYSSAQTFGSTAQSVIVPGAAFDANFGAFLGAVSAAIFTGFFIVALLTLVILFFIRTVILLMLLILSPLPYAFGLIPAAQGYARQWWEQFVKYVIYGPVTILLTVLIVRILDRKGSQGTAAQQLFNDLGASTAKFGGGAVSENLAAAAFFTTFIVFYIIVAILIGNKLGIAGAGMATNFGRRVALGAAYYGSGAGVGMFAGRKLWERTGGAAFEGYKQAQAQRQKDRVRTGFLGRLGTRVGAGFSPTAQQAIQRRQEDEEVKDLKTRGVPLDQLELNNVAHARFAAQEGLYEGASEDQNRQILETLTRAGRTGTGEFGRVRRDYLTRLPHTGVKNLAAMRAIPAGEIANEQKKAVGKLGGLDYVKAMQNEQKQGVNLLEQYPITGGHVRSVYEHGGDAESRTLLAQRGGPRFTRGAETEVRRREPQSPPGPPPGPVTGGGPGV